MNIDKLIESSVRRQLTDTERKAIEKAGRLNEFYIYNDIMSLACGDEEKEARLNGCESYKSIAGYSVTFEGGDEY